MKVLNILTTKFEISGITNSVMNYFRYIDKSDTTIDFVIPNELPDRLSKEIKENGGNVFTLSMRNRNPLKYIYCLKRVIIEGNYDIVHAHGNSATLFFEMYAAKRAGVKVRIAHSRNTTCKYRIIDKILRPFFNATYTHGFACGKAAGKWLFGKRDFYVITNGNDVDKYKFNSKIREKYRKKLNLQGQTVIGHVGLFNYQKNHDFLIDVFSELTSYNPKYRLLLIGDGELRDSIEKKVREKGLTDKVIFTGKSLEVEKLIQAVDIMVLPSRFEGLPNVVIEWQIACVPSLVSDIVTEEVKITDLVEFMPLEAGYKAWARKITEMELVDRQTINDPILLEINKAGFNIRENAKELKKIYGKLVRNSQYGK